MRIAIDNPKGERPIMAAHALEHNEAQVANNCKLIKGDLRAFRAPEKQAALLLTDTAKTIFIYSENGNSNWVESVNDLDFVKSPISGDQYERVYFTGESEPRFFSNDNVSSPFDASVDFLKLGIPAPSNAPTVGAGTGTDPRGYAYAFINSYGDEGPPSDPTIITTFNTGDTITISGLDAAPADRAVTTLRIYRTNASAAGVAEYQKAMDATWFDVTTDYSVGDWVIYSNQLYKCTTIHPAAAWNASHFTAGDDVADSDLLTVFPKTNYDPPPDGLTCLVSHPSGSLCGIDGNRLYMSEPHQPHAWPTDYIVAFDSTPVSIDVYGTVIVVATSGFPQYLVFGNTPGQMTKKKMAKHYHCTSKRGMVAAEDGVFYPTKEGLVFVNGDGARIITSPSLMSSDEWSEYNPDVMHGVFYEKKYFGFDSVGGNGFIIDFDQKSFIPITVTAHASHLADDGKLYLTLDDTAIIDENNPPANMPLCVSEWEGSTTDFLLFTWRSKEFILDRPTNFSVAQIKLDQAFYDQISALFDLATLNAALFAADLEGAIGMNAIGMQDIAGDTLFDIGDYSVSQEMTFKFYAGGELKKTKVISSTDNVFRLPGGYLSDTVYFEISGYLPVKHIIIAPSVDEL